MAQRSPKRVRSRSLALLFIIASIGGCLSNDSPSSSSEPAEPPEDTSAPWPNLEDAVLRPGVKAPGCTTNFLFQSADNSTLYLGVAAHCFGGQRIGTRILVGEGEGIDLGNRGIETTLVYCSWATRDGTDLCRDATTAGLVLEDSPEISNDFALLEIDPDDRHLAHPAVMHWGGPTRLLNETVLVGATVMTYGNSGGRDAGQGSDDPTDARQGVVVDASGHRTIAMFAGPGISGDSGSPVLSEDGAALGVIVTFGGANGISNLAPMVAYLHANTDLDVGVVTWPLLAHPL